MIDEATVEAWVRDANPIASLDDVDADEFAAFVAAARRRKAAVMAAPTQRPTPPLVHTARVRRRAVGAFAAAFILVLAAVGVAALVTRDDGAAPVADESDAPVPVESLTWFRIPHDPVVFNPTGGVDVMMSVTAGGPGFVAVGTADILDTGQAWRDGAVWISEDGVTWSLVPDEAPPLGGPGMQEVESVTVGGPGLVAVGHEAPEGSYLWGYPAVWTSEDGMSWSRVPHDTAVFLGGGMHDVTVGGPGLVAVGSAVWTSPDGLTWTRVPLPAEADALMRSVTVGGPGLVAVGSADVETELDPDYSIPAVWTSRDGLVWSRVPHDEAVFGDAELFDVTVGGPGLVAVGSVGNSAAAWTSPDGFTWMRVPHDVAVFGGEGGDERSMNAVTSVGPQLVAVGGSGYESTLTSPAPLVWTSVDGMTWSRIEPDIGRGRMHDVAATSQGIIAVGQEDGAAAIWIATQG